MKIKGQLELFRITQHFLSTSSNLRLLFHPVPLNMGQHFSNSFVTRIRAQDKHA